VIVPYREIPAIAARLEVIRRKEERMLSDINSGKFMPEGFAAQLEARGVEIIE